MLSAILGRRGQVVDAINISSIAVKVDPTTKKPCTIEAFCCGGTENSGTKPLP
jgi:hypothetical protein